MRRVRKRIRKRKRSSARLDAFARGMIWAFSLAGWKRTDIQTHVEKTDGSEPHIKTIGETLPLLLAAAAQGVRVAMLVAAASWRASACGLHWMHP